MSKQFIPPGGPPQEPIPSKAIYGKMGRENIFRMCRDFYRELEKSSIRYLFDEDMENASKRIAAFFVQIFGGPPVFNELYGPPVMRSRHLKFNINEEMRQVWLSCFYRTLEHADAYAFPPEHLEEFKGFLDVFSAWMVSRKDAEE